MEKPAWVSQELWDDEMVFAPLVDAFIRARLGDMVERTDAEMMELQSVYSVSGRMTDARHLTRKSVSA